MSGASGYPNEGVTSWNGNGSCRVTVYLDVCSGKLRQYDTVVELYSNGDGQSPYGGADSEFRVKFRILSISFPCNLD